MFSGKKLFSQFSSFLGVTLIRDVVALEYSSGAVAGDPHMIVAGHFFPLSLFGAWRDIRCRRNESRLMVLAVS
jgi:hypothetical protein